MAKQFGKSDRWILSGEEYTDLKLGDRRVDSDATTQRIKELESQAASARAFQRQYDELLVQFRALVKQHHEAAIEQKTALLILEDLSQERFGTSKLTEMMKEQAKNVKYNGELSISTRRAGKMEALKNTIADEQRAQYLLGGLPDFVPNDAGGDDSSDDSGDDADDSTG